MYAISGCDGALGFCRKRSRPKQAPLEERETNFASLGLSSCIGCLCNSGITCQGVFEDTNQLCRLSKCSWRLRWPLASQRPLRFAGPARKMQRRGSTEAQKGARQGGSHQRAPLQHGAAAGPWQLPPHPILDLIMEHLLAGEEGARWVSGSLKCLAAAAAGGAAAVHTTAVVPACRLGRLPACSGMACLLVVHY